VGNLQSQSITWQRVFGGPGDDQGRAITQTLDGGYAFVGKGVTANFYKLDAYGNLEWLKNFTSGGFLVLNNIIQLSDSNYIIGGNKLTTQEIILIKTNKLGDTLWSKILSYNGLATSLSSLKLLNDGGFIMCGDVLFSSPPGTRAYVTRVDSKGNLIWHNDYMDSTNTGANDIIALPSGSFFFTSWTYNNLSYGFLNKLNSGGVRIWSKQILGFNNYPRIDVANILQEETNSLAIDGTYDSLQLYRFGAIIKYDTNGTQIFFRSYPPYGSGFMHRALNGNYLFTGLGGAPNYDVPFLRLDTQANIRYYTEINSGGNELDNGEYIDKTSDNGSIIVGETTYGGSTFYANFLVIKTDSAGNAPPVKIISNTEIYPKEFKLYPNYPNPFNNQTNFQVDIPKKGYINVIIYNTLGQQIQNIYEGVLASGEHLFMWDVNSSIPSGVYFIKVSYNSSFKILKVAFVK